MQHLPQHKKIILFDGLCNLCDGTVQFIIKRDTKDVFRFVSLQSDLGRELLQKLPIEFQLTDSVILYESEKVFFYKSQAVFEIVKSIGGIYYCLLIFKLLPNAITNAVYNFIAKNRFRWWGKKESCLVPSKDLQSKFLE